MLIGRADDNGPRDITGAVLTALARAKMAETGGFEPPIQVSPDPSLAVKSIRPLWHVSVLSSGRVHSGTVLIKQRTTL